MDVDPYHRLRTRVFVNHDYNQTTRWILVMWCRFWSILYNKISSNFVQCSYLIIIMGQKSWYGTCWYDTPPSIICLYSEKKVFLFPPSFLSLRYLGTLPTPCSFKRRRFIFKLFKRDTDPAGYDPDPDPIVKKTRIRIRPLFSLIFFYFNKKKSLWLSY